MLAKIFNALFRLKKPRYTYGSIMHIDGSVRNRARFDNKTIQLEFVLWRKGEMGHEEDYWHRMGDGWLLKFKPD